MPVKPPTLESLILQFLNKEDWKSCDDISDAFALSEHQIQKVLSHISDQVESKICRINGTKKVRLYKLKGAK